MNHYPDATGSGPARRGVLTGALVAVALGVAHSAGRALGGVAVAARPGAAGRSTTRCAQCGSADHTMLDAGCPARPEVI